MKTGTCNFKSLFWAVVYYEKQGIDYNEVLEKIQNGEIEIGKPRIEEGEYLIIEDGRYFIHS